MIYKSLCKECNQFYENDEETELEECPPYCPNCSRRIDAYEWREMQWKSVQRN